MQDFKTSDKAYQGYQHSRTRTIVFIIPGVVRGGVTSSNEIRFPYAGEVIECYGSCKTPAGINPVTFTLEKCSQVTLDVVPDWIDILSTPVRLDVGEKSSNTTSVPCVISQPVVEENDHFRVNVLGTDEVIRDLTIEVMIKLI